MEQLTAQVDVAVIGAGTMGTGIAEVLARSGHSVRIVDSRSGSASAAIDRIAKTLGRDISRDRLEAHEAHRIVGRLRPVDSIADLAGCGLVIESVAEDLAVKRDVLRAAEEAAGQGVGHEVLLATNTSSISVTAVAAALSRPELLVGLHFFN
ncbi:MAG TPA: 3-hydroxyacyl-CoA dehydrogenase NAD-binding domain-containing protein, partial [Kineosporiaceae bacterium]|nr:3-hydroxyacyl-CoA dehydrogenase NAD-binding domain-containing protein [Kineosporiaceae bacterium]